MTTNNSCALDLLQEIDQRCRENAVGLPQHVELKNRWSGIGFHVNNQHFVAELGEVIEIMHMPIVTRAPGTHTWVLGVANVRGMLIPVIDLQAFLGGKSIGMRRSARVLVIRHGDVVSGLLVTEVIGLRHFFTEDRQDVAPEDNAAGAFVVHEFDTQPVKWGLFSMKRLAESSLFLSVAN